MSRSREIGYVGFGLASGILLTLGLAATAVLTDADAKLELAGGIPWLATTTPTPTTPPTPTAQPTGTPLPTTTSTLTLTPTPTATLTTAQLLQAAGEIAAVGPLSDTERLLHLFDAASRYVAPSTTESRAMGELINGAGYGSPSLICGPLSAVILRDVGLIPADTSPHDFWLLNPKLPPDRALLNTTFPPGQFEHIVDKNPLNRINWLLTPLYPGDFLYIEEGTGGNFDHMLVVSRVDSQGRAFAVTNFSTSTGFVINEALLYDPSGFHEGLFDRWTEKPNALSGSTGFGGYELWRLRGPQT